MNYSPYAQVEANAVYNLLFCDDLELFRPRNGQPSSVDPLFQQDCSAIERLAKDINAESRVRILSCNWLRQRSLAVPPKVLLGVVVEVALDGGLDVLAAYSDGRIRYINRAGRMTIFEAAHVPVSENAKSLLTASKNVVARLGPWGKPRLPPPGRGNARLTFLVSDGLYFGEGRFSDMQRDPIGGSIIQIATALLTTIVQTTTSQE
jgi:hypothetical protein